MFQRGVLLTYFLPSFIITCFFDEHWRYEWSLPSCGYSFKGGTRGNSNALWGWNEQSLIRGEQKPEAGQRMLGTVFVRIDCPWSVQWRKRWGSHLPRAGGHTFYTFSWWGCLITVLQWPGYPLIFSIKLSRGGRAFIYFCFLVSRTGPGAWRVQNACTFSLIE